MMDGFFNEKRCNFGKEMFNSKKNQKKNNLDVNLDSFTSTIDGLTQAGKISMSCVVRNKVEIFLKNENKEFVHSCLCCCLQDKKLEKYVKLIPVETAAYIPDFGYPILNSNNSTMCSIGYAVKDLNDKKIYAITVNHGCFPNKNMYGYFPNILFKDQSGKSIGSHFLSVFSKKQLSNEFINVRETFSNDVLSEGGSHAINQTMTEKLPQITINSHCEKGYVPVPLTYNKEYNFLNIANTNDKTIDFTMIELQPGILQYETATKNTQQLSIGSNLYLHTPRFNGFEAKITGLDGKVHTGNGLLNSLIFVNDSMKRTRKGDSGSVYKNSKGELVAVHLGRYEFTLMGSHDKKSFNVALPIYDIDKTLRYAVICRKVQLGLI